MWGEVGDGQDAGLDRSTLGRGAQQIAAPSVIESRVLPQLVAQLVPAVDDDAKALPLVGLLGVLVGKLSGEILDRRVRLRGGADH